MKILKILISIFYVFVVLEACVEKNVKSKDGFYTNKGDWDSRRIPLLKPYDAIISSEAMGWTIGLDGIDGDTGFYNIKNVNVINGIILIYSTNSILHGIDVKQSWHIIIPTKRIEKGFDNHEEYLEYLSKLGMTSEPRLFEIDQVAEYFNERDTIDWKLIK